MTTLHFTSSEPHTSYWLCDCKVVGVTEGHWDSSLADSDFFVIGQKKWRSIPIGPVWRLQCDSNAMLFTILCWSENKFLFGSNITPPNLRLNKTRILFNIAIYINYIYSNISVQSLFRLLFVARQIMLMRGHLCSYHSEVRPTWIVLFK